MKEENWQRKVCECDVRSVKESATRMASVIAVVLVVISDGRR